MVLLAAGVVDIATVNLNPSRNLSIMSSYSYADIFRCKPFWSQDLLNPTLMRIVREQGFQWIRRLDTRRFEQIVRNPTVGCMVELCYLQQPGCVHLDSPAAKKMLTKLCYFR
jgi:hypothetical protein